MGNYTSSPGYEQPAFVAPICGDAQASDAPLTIVHNGPPRSMTFFPGIVERDMKKPAKKEKKPSLFDDDEEEFDAVRGRVIGLSRKSRKNLMGHILQNKFQFGRVWFLTLTYPNEFPLHWVAKKNLRAFLKRVSRRFGKYGAIWRIENQKRGAPHFHIILYLSAFVSPDEITWWCIRNWYEVVGSDDPKHLTGLGFNCQLFEKPRGVAAYCSKYVAKQEEGERVQLIEGRQWGREGVFPVESLEFLFFGDDFFRVMRILRRINRLSGHAKKRALTRAQRRKLKKNGGLHCSEVPIHGFQWKTVFCHGLHPDILRVAESLGCQSNYEAESFYQ